MDLTDAFIQSDLKKRNKSNSSRSQQYSQYTLPGLFDNQI